MKKLTPYSFSKLQMYDQCAKKFKYRYIDRAPQGPTDRTALIKGGAVHSILEHYPDESTHKLAWKYKSITDKFIASDLGMRYLLMNGLNEVSFGLTDELEPCEYKDKKALFRGKIDRVSVHDNMLYLIDWKTGKSKEEKWQDFRQLLFYAIFFFKKYPTIDKIKISYVYVEHDKENQIILERKYLDNYIKELTYIIQKLESDSEFLKTKSKLCDYCDFKDHCSKDT